MFPNWARLTRCRPHFNQLRPRSYAGVVPQRWLSYVAQALRARILLVEDVDHVCRNVAKSHQMWPHLAESHWQSRATLLTDIGRIWSKPSRSWPISGPIPSKPHDSGPKHGQTGENTESGRDRPNVVNSMPNSAQDPLRPGGTSFDWVSLSLRVGRSRPEIGNHRQLVELAPKSGEFAQNCTDSPQNWLTPPEIGRNRSRLGNLAQMWSKSFPHWPKQPEIGRSPSGIVRNRSVQPVLGQMPIIAH